MKFSILVFLAIAIFTQPIFAKSSFSVRTEYKKGRKLYLQKKYLNASYVLAHILKKFPSHEPSAVLLARIYYRVKNYNSAGELLKKMIVENLEPVEQYEYGHVFSHLKDYTRCRQAFSIISRDHAVHDLAQFYAAICSIRLKKYAEAEYSLRQSVVLPVRLAKRRKLYLKHVRSILLNKEKNLLKRAEAKALRQMQKTLQKDLQDEKMLPPMVTYTKKRKKQKEKKAAPIQFGFYFNHQTSKYENAKDITNDPKILYFRYKDGPQFTLYKRKQNKVVVGIHGALGLDYSIEGGLIRDHGFEDKYTQYHSIYEVYKENTANLSVGVMPYLKATFQKNWEFYLSAEYERIFPEVVFSNLAGIHQVFSSIKVDQTHWSAMLKLRSRWLRDLNNQTFIWSNQIKLSTAWKFSEVFRILPALQADFFNYFENPLTGPERVFLVKLGAEQDFPFNTTLHASLFAGLIQENITYDIAPIEVKSEGTKYGVALSGSISPLPWLTITANHRRALIDWTTVGLNNPSVLAKFLESTSNNIIQTEMKMMLNLAF